MILFWQYHSIFLLCTEKIVAWVLLSTHIFVSSLGQRLDSAFTLMPIFIKRLTTEMVDCSLYRCPPPTSFLHSLPVFKQFLTSLVFCHFFPSPWVGETLFGEFPWFQLVLYQTGQTATGPPPLKSSFLSSATLLFSLSVHSFHTYSSPFNGSYISWVFLPLITSHATISYSPPLFHLSCSSIINMSIIKIIWPLNSITLHTFINITSLHPCVPPST